MTNADLLATIEAQRREIAEQREALAESMTVINDWLHTYADDLCHPADVDESRKRISDCGGTIGYIARSLQKIRAAIAGDKP